MTDETRVALLEQNMTEMKQDLSDIKAEIKSLGKSMDQILSTTNNEQTEIKAEIKSLQKDIENIQKTSNLWRWLSPTMAAALSAIMTFLILNFLQNLK